MAPFCGEIKHDGTKSLATTRCTDQRDSLALCNLIPYRRALPIDYRNFGSLRGVRAEGLKYYGGSVELADFCPYNQEFEWKTVVRTDRRDSRCELDGNRPPDENGGNPVLELYGHGSRCLDFGGSSWTEQKCGRVRTYSQFMAGCYRFVCADGRVNIRLHNSTRLYPCYRPDQPINIRRLVNGWLREGQILCPDCMEFCDSATVAAVDSRSFASAFASANSSAIAAAINDDVHQHYHQVPVCLPPSDPPWPIGDPPLDEPCSACRSADVATLLLFPILLSSFFLLLISF